MNGRAAHSDWSDDDAVVSGSATEAEEASNRRKKSNNKHTPAPAKALNSRFDPVNAILDKIDAELSNLANKSQSSSGTGSTVIPRSSRDDTELNGSYDRSGGIYSKSVSDDMDTGLGTGTGQGDKVSDRFINGTAEIYSDAPEDISRKGAPSDLDSVSAQNVDDKFKEIMRKKKGGLFDNLRKGPPQSDAETIKTEDFEDRFKETLVHQSDSDTLEDNNSDTLTETDDNLDWGYFESKPKSKKGSRNGRQHFRSHTVDAYPSRTAAEDPDETDRKCITPPLQTRHRGGGSMPPRYPRANNFDSVGQEERQRQPRQRHKKNYTSDADSVRTEDFEVRFKDMIVKPGEITDSQGDLTDNDPLHAKVKQILQVTAPYRSDEHSTKADRDRSPSNVDRDSGRYSGKAVNGHGHKDNPSSSLWPKRSSSIADSLDEDRKEIERESARIQQEMERERRSKSLSPRRDARSPTRTMLSLSPDKQEISGRNSPVISQTEITSSRNNIPDSPPGGTTRSSRDRNGLKTSNQGRQLPRPRSPLGGSLRSSHETGQERPSSPFDSRIASNQDGVPARSSSPIAYKPTSSHNGPTRSGRSSSPIAERFSPSVASSGHASRKSSEDKLSVSFQEFPTNEKVKPTKTSRSLSLIELPPSIFKSNIRGLVSSWGNPEDVDELHTDLTTTKEDLHNTSIELKSAKVDLKDAEKKLKIVLAKTEDARTQLMLTEYKRDNTINDLERLQEDLGRKKKQVKDYEDQLRSRIGEIRHIDSQGTDDNTADLIKENESLKLMLRHNDGLELERDELVRQLELAKEDLFNEQRNSRNKIEELTEEIENLSAQAEESKTSQDQVQNKLEKMEASYRQMEKEKNEIIQEQSDLYKEVRDQAKKEHIEARQRSTSEAQDLREEITELCTKINKLQGETREKEDLVLKSRNQMLELRKQLTREVNIKDSLIEDHKRTLQTIRKEMDTAMVQLRDNLFLDKQKALEDLRYQLEKDRHSSVVRLEEKLNHQYAEHAKIVQTKEEEITKFLTLIQNMEEDKKTMEERIRNEYKSQVLEEINRERGNMESKLALRLQQEREQLKKEEEQKVKNITTGYDQERKLRENLSEQVKQFKKDLEDQKQQTKQAIHEKLIDVARAKETMRRDMQAELEQTVEKLRQEHQRELQKLQETVRLQKEELQKLKAERQKYLKYELDNTTKSYRSERMIVNELNEECRKTAGVLGIAPRKISVSDYRGENHPPNGMRGRSATTASLANLRACNEELRNHVQELKQEMELQRAMLTRAERDKGDVVQNLKLQLEREKNAELEKMKEKLVKEYAEEHSRINKKYMDRDKIHLRTLQQKEEALQNLRHDFNQWKAVTDAVLLQESGDKKLNTEKQYSKQHPRVNQYEFHPRSETQQHEIERLEREIRRLAMNQNRMMAKTPVYDDISEAKLLNQLQATVKHLQQQPDINNLPLNNKLSYSVPDLANSVFYRHNMTRTPTPHQERMVNLLEQRSKEGQMESDTAEAVQNRNRNMMSQKMYEMTKLQNSLTKQAEDLIHLNKAYNSLNNSVVSSPSRSSSATR